MTQNRHPSQVELSPLGSEMSFDQLMASLADEQLSGNANSDANAGFWYFGNQPTPLHPPSPSSTSSDSTPVHDDSAFMFMPADSSDKEPTLASRVESRVPTSLFEPYPSGRTSSGSASSGGSASTRVKRPRSSSSESETAMHRQPKVNIIGGVAIGDKGETVDQRTLIAAVKNTKKRPANVGDVEELDEKQMIRWVDETGSALASTEEKFYDISMLRNRAAAQESRDRKKRYQNSLESTNEALVAQNRQLASKVQGLEAQNRFFLGKLAEFEGVISFLKEKLTETNFTEVLFGSNTPTSLPTTIAPSALPTFDFTSILSPAASTNSVSSGSSISSGATMLAPPSSLATNLGLAPLASLSVSPNIPLSPTGSSSSISSSLSLSLHPSLTLSSASHFLPSSQPQPHPSLAISTPYLLASLPVPSSDSIILAAAVAASAYSIVRHAASTVVPSAPVARRTIVRALYPNRAAAREFLLKLAALSSSLMSRPGRSFALFFRAAHSRTGRTGDAIRAAARPQVSVRIPSETVGAGLVQDLTNQLRGRAAEAGQSGEVVRAPVAPQPRQRSDWSDHVARFGRAWWSGSSSAERFGFGLRLGESGRGAAAGFGSSGLGNGFGRGFVDGLAGELKGIAAGLGVVGMGASRERFGMPALAWAR
ncbi:hypothetical protein HDU93_008183 [Gonapodya sp. JEL0774]|nr:hypothetical protein HDU93_008183 [Gonapodya sp. JEL0774]